MVGEELLRIFSCNKVRIILHMISKFLSTRYDVYFFPGMNRERTTVTNFFWGFTYHILLHTIPTLDPEEVLAFPAQDTLAFDNLSIFFFEASFMQEAPDIWLSPTVIPSFRDIYTWPVTWPSNERRWSRQSYVGIHTRPVNALLRKMEMTLRMIGQAQKQPSPLCSCIWFRNFGNNCNSLESNMLLSCLSRMNMTIFF